MDPTLPAAAHPAIAQGPLARRALPPASRAFCFRGPRSHPPEFTPMQLLGGPDGAYGCAFHLLDGRVWEPLALAFGPCDATVDGLFSPAKLFVFETDMAFFLCESERNLSTWRRAAKPGGPSAPPGALRPLKRFDNASPAGIDARNFFDSILVGMALADAETMGLLRSELPELASMAESAALRAAAPAGPAAGPTRRI